MNLYTLAVIVHVLATSVGFGAVVINDLQFHRAIGDAEAGAAYQRNARGYSLLIWLALLFLAVTALVFVTEKPVLLESPKILTKLGIVCVIAVNGLVMNLLLHRRLAALTAVDWAKRTDQLRQLVFLGLPFGVISMVSWLAALVLGAAGRQPWTAADILPWYGGAIVVGWVVGWVVFSRKLAAVRS